MAIYARNLAGATLVAAAVALSSLTAGAGLAAADPGRGPGQCPPQGCEQNGPGGHDQNGPGHQSGWGNQNNGPGNQNGPGDRNGWGNQGPQGYRGIDQGRQDHRPFDWQGQQVAPIFAPQFNQWGFWFLGLWIPL